MLNAQFQQTKANHDEVVRFLRDDEAHNRLTDLKKKVAAQEQMVYSLNDCAFSGPKCKVWQVLKWLLCVVVVEARSQQSDYRQVKENVTLMTADLNKLCVKAMGLH